MILFSSCPFETFNLCFTRSISPFVSRMNGYDPGFWCFFLLSFPSHTPSSSRHSPIHSFVPFPYYVVMFFFLFNLTITIDTLFLTPPPLFPSSCFSPLPGIAAQKESTCHFSLAFPPFLFRFFSSLLYPPLCFPLFTCFSFFFLFFQQRDNEFDVVELDFHLFQGALKVSSNTREKHCMGEEEFIGGADAKLKGNKQNETFVPKSTFSQPSSQRPLRRNL